LSNFATPYFCIPAQILLTCLLFRPQNRPKMNTRKYIDPRGIHFQAERQTYETAERQLEGTGFTVAEYLRFCLSELAKGKVAVQKPKLVRQGAVPK
jgi:hypothetical protein